MVTIHTLGDSVLDCGHYNAHGVHPAQLLLRNDDALFPEFRGQDLSSHDHARLVHAASDGATLDSLPQQVARRPVEPGSIVLLSIGGNDLIGGLARGGPDAVDAWSGRLRALLDTLPQAHVLVANVYDPTFGDDTRNFLTVAPDVARASHRALNAALAAAAAKHGTLVDVHEHFLRSGDPSWFTFVIEPSLKGASEIRRCFLPHVLRWAK